MAVDYVQHLADFYRSIMVHREKNFIPLSEDLDIARNFGFLLKKRFEDALQIHIDVPVPIGRLMPLTLQMLLENAVKHNVISKKQPLKIDIYLENNDTIVVKNNKNLKIKPEPGTRFGLQNLAQRYEVLTGKKVVVEQSNGSFVVKIPLD
jgi:LytS/YehU family sensor histidine kinase